MQLICKSWASLHRKRTTILPVSPDSCCDSTTRRLDYGLLSEPSLFSLWLQYKRDYGEIPVNERSVSRIWHTEHALNWYHGDCCLDTERIDRLDSCLEINKKALKFNNNMAYLGRLSQWSGISATGHWPPILYAQIAACSEKLES
jgi:hypothetical protein